MKTLLRSLPFLLLASTALGQGDLTPPAGAPAPNMKTLQEIWHKLELIASDAADAKAASETAAVAAPDPRTPITTLPYVIDTPGSYYFTGNLNFTMDTGAAIEITVGNVTLDLDGFTLSSDLNVTGEAILLSMDFAAGGESWQRTCIKNGTIVGSSTLAGASPPWTLTAAGFEHGISITPNAQRVDLLNITVLGCQSHGIEMRDYSTAVDCRSSRNGGRGFSARLGCQWTRCVAVENNSSGFDSSNSACFQCTAVRNGGTGFFAAEGIVSYCLSSDNGGSGYDFNFNPGVLSFSRAQGNGTVALDGDPSVIQTGNSLTP